MTKCPECGGELESFVDTRGNLYFKCCCCERYFDEDGEEIGCGQKMSDDDYELANFCHGGDLD